MRGGLEGGRECKSGLKGYLVGEMKSRDGTSGAWRES